MPLMPTIIYYTKAIIGLFNYKKKSLTETVSGNSEHLKIIQSINDHRK